MGDPFAAAAVFDALDAPEELDGRVTALQRELAWSAPGHVAAVEAAILGLLVLVLRLRQAADGVAVGLNRQAELVAGLRLLLNEGPNALPSLAACAQALGVSVGRLQRARRIVTGHGPLAVIRERRMLAARRLLAYSTLNVAQVAYSLGTDDAAYFSRLFTRVEGVSPRAYRVGLRNLAE